jgi:hypothetical protein
MNFMTYGLLFGEKQAHFLKSPVMGKDVTLTLERPLIKEIN